MRVRTLAAAFAAAAIAIVSVQPAAAQEKRVRLNMGMAFPSANAILGPGQVALTEKVRKMSNGSIDMRHFEPGAMVPASQYFDAVSNGSLNSAWSGLGFFTGKDIAFALFSSVPFGPEMGEYLAWMRVGGGEQSCRSWRASTTSSQSCAARSRLKRPAGSARRSKRSTISRA